MRVLTIATALIIAVSSVTVAHQVDRPMALRAAGRALDRALSVGSKDIVPKDALRRAIMDEIFYVHHPESLEPAYGLVPIRSPRGGVIGVVAVGAESGEWRWLSFSYSGERFPAISAAEASRKVRARSHMIGEDDAISAPVLIRGYDKHLYWRCESNGEPWLIDAFDSNAAPASRMDPSYSKAMTRAPSLVDPHHVESGPPTGLSSPGDDPLATIPAAYCLPGVPYHWQIVDWYCGPASLQMMMDFCGEEIGQYDIGDAANEAPSYGTMDTDNRRAAHFSGMSRAKQDSTLQGYVERQLGYAAIDNSFFTNQASRLKNTIYAGYPVFTLTYYDEYQNAGHYRVVKGYDDSLDVFVIHDPWYAWDLCGPDLLIRQDFFVDTLWVYSGHWCMVVSPWIVTPAVPTSVSQGDTFSVNLKVLYPGPTRFGGSLPCSSCVARIDLSAGLALAGGSNALSLPVMVSGDSASVSWDVVAVGPAGDRGMAFQAQGILEASSFSYSSYTDSIGGHAYATVEIGGGSLLAGWDTEERLTSDLGSSITSFPGGRAMTVSDDGTVHLVWADTRDANSEIYYLRQSEGTWEAEVRLTDDPGHSHSPCIAEGPDGSLHVAWVDDRDGDQEIFYKGWNPVGGWAGDERVANWWEVDCCPTIAAGESEVYVAWQRRLGDWDRTAAVYFSIRTGPGWSAPVDVDASAIRDSYRPSIGYGPDGIVHVVYERQTSDTADERETIAYRSWDGVTWSTRADLSTDSSYSRNPVVAVAPDSTLHVVWQDGENTGGDVFYAMYDGSAWQAAEQVVTGGTDASTPSVAAVGASEVHVAWVDHRHGEPEIYLVSNDGLGWTGESRLSNAPGISNLPTVDVDASGGAYVVWTDMRHGNADLYFRATSGASDVADKVVVHDTTGPIHLSAPYPVPAASDVRFMLTMTQTASVSLRVYDIHGRVVRTLTDGVYGAGSHRLEWNGKDDLNHEVAPGVYFLRCSSPLGQDVRLVARIR